MMPRVPRGAGAGCRQRQRLAEAESGCVVCELVLVVLLEHSRHKRLDVQSLLEYIFFVLAFVYSTG